MPFRLQFTKQATADLRKLEQRNDQVKLKEVRKALGNLQRDPFYPALRSHKYSSLRGAQGEDVFDSYVQNHSPRVWRIFWHEGPGADVVTVLTVTTHP